MPKIIDLTHRVFDRLTVIRKLPMQHPNDRIIKWECRCSCGSTKTVIGRTNQLTSGLLRSCGCLRREIVGKANTTHGLIDSSEYRTWLNIKARCCNKNHLDFPGYGGRGITVCDEWKESFEAFYRDMGPRPSPQHSIDRRENDKGYSKENCRWATQKEQCNNRRTNVVYDFDGEKKTLTEWCQEFNVDYELVRKRIKKGISFEDALDAVASITKKIH